MIVDFSEIIQNFLTAEIGEDVRESLVEIAQTLEDAINAQLLTVDSDLNDTSPNAAAQSSVVGDLFGKSLKYKSWVSSGATGVTLANQTVNTFCRLHGITAADGPTGADLDDGYAWLYMTGVEDGNKHQFLFCGPEGELYFRYTYGVIRDGAEVIEWHDWIRIADTAIRSSTFIGAVNGHTTPNNQPGNTICRISKVTLEDVPTEVDVSGNYYAWLYTAGTGNKHQMLFYPHTGGMYYRCGNVLSASPYYRWSDWFQIAGEGSSDKVLKILVIGNSFDQDAMAYVPKIVNELLPDYEITYCTLYAGSATMQQHVQWFNNDTPYQIKSTWSPSSSKWTRRNPGGTLRQALATDWDIIVLQGTSAETISTSDVTAMLESARELLRILQANAAKPFTPVWFQWMSRAMSTYTSAQMFDFIKNATTRAMQELGIMDYIPVGAAFQSARTNTTLQALGDGGDMIYSDDTHMQAGIPALLAAYTVSLKILEWTGNKNKGIYRSTFVPNDSACREINALSLSIEDDQVRVSGMTHGLAALGSDETEEMVVVATPAEIEAGETDQTIYVEKVTEDVKQNIYAVQEIAQIAVNNPTTVTDCSGLV